MKDVSKIRVGVFGHVRGNNLGDETIISEVIRNLRWRIPHVEIVAFTLNPVDSQERHKVVSFPIRKMDNIPPESKESRNKRVSVNGEIKQSPLANKIKALLKRSHLIYVFLKGIQKLPYAVRAITKEPGFLFTCFRNLRGIDLLIVAGSQQLIDFVGVWFQAFTIFKWTCIARLTGTKVAFLSVGAGPITTRLGKFFIKYCLAQACYKSLRDEISRRVLKEIGVNAQIEVFPDLAFSLEIESSYAGAGPGKSGPIVAINPVPFFDPVSWPGSNKEIYKRYVNTLGRFALWLIQKGYSVLFFPTQVHLDPSVIGDIRSAMKEECPHMPFENRIIEWPVQSVSDLTSAISDVDIVVAARFHGVVIPFVLNKPVLAVAYHAKTVDLMAQMGQSEFVLDIRSFDESQLQERFSSLEVRSEEVRNEIEQRVISFRKTLDSQYDRLVSLV